MSGHDSTARLRFFAAAACCIAAGGACSSGGGSSNPGFGSSGGSANGGNGNGSNENGSGSGGDNYNSSSSGSGNNSSGTGGNSGSGASNNYGGGAGQSSSSAGGNGSGNGTGSSSSSGGGSSSGAASSSSSSSGAVASSGAGSTVCAPSPPVLGPPTWMVASGAITFAQPNYSTLGMGGYAYPYADTGGSMACLDGAAFCGQGTTAATTTATAATAWGAGVGVNVNQMAGIGTTKGTYTPTGKSGITYAVSSLPTVATLRLTIDSSGTEYYANLTATSGMVPWAMFTTTPWTTGGPALAAAPVATHVQLQAVAVTTGPGTFNFCVTTLAFY